ncbi:MAG: aminomethyl-transferring glycine dehydrogenase subunit GcvPB [Armatimonadota bacterium]
MYDKSIFELSVKGRKGIPLPDTDVSVKDIKDIIPSSMQAEELKDLPEVSQLDVVRHFTSLSRKNFSVDTHFYPLGSCTMKYNPKINEQVANLPGFTGIHPYQDTGLTQGSLFIISELERCLCEITGMDAFTMQPAAGAHGELTALLIIKKYFDKKEEARTKIIVPDSAHGTNPASAAMAGFDVVQVKSDYLGNMDMEDFISKIDETVAAVMLTNPNTLGLFETNILEIEKLAHEKGALIYYDGANANAILGIARPGDMGFDLIHLNLHKTFATPHGGGGPGSGPVGVKSFLEEFLPVPRVKLDSGASKYFMDYDNPSSIGRVRAFYGNFLVLVKAYAYILSLGAEGLKKVSQTAVLNANYIMKSLASWYHLPYGRICQHEFVLSAKEQKEHGVKALDIAKRLLDYGIHAPTVYFPLIVEEALMIEPTETESKQKIEEFIAVMKKIAEEAEKTPELLKEAPHTTPVMRLDETMAARNPILKYTEENCRKEPIKAGL